MKQPVLSPERVTMVKCYGPLRSARDSHNRFVGPLPRKFGVKVLGVPRTAVCRASSNGNTTKILEAILVPKTAKGTYKQQPTKTVPSKPRKDQKLERQRQSEKQRKKDGEMNVKKEKNVYVTLENGKGELFIVPNLHLHLRGQPMKSPSLTRRSTWGTAW